VRITMDIPVDIEAMEAALEGLVELNRVLIERGDVPMSPADAGVIYQREGRGLEEWRNAGEVVAAGSGDCEDLNGWLAAGYRASGYDPYARVALEQTGSKTFHAVVELSSGERVDCCPELGMRVPTAGEDEGVGFGLPRFITRVVSRAAGGGRARGGSAARGAPGVRDKRSAPTDQWQGSAPSSDTSTRASNAAPAEATPTTPPIDPTTGLPYGTPYGGTPYMPGTPYGGVPFGGYPTSSPAAAAVYAQQMAEDVDYAAAYDAWLEAEHAFDDEEPFDEEEP
jgi:hypothetical protein